MDCFGDICKLYNQFDSSLNKIISRFHKLNSNQLIISESINLVANYEITNGFAPLESWSFPQLSQLSFPVIVDNSSNDENQYIIALQEPNLLTKWSFGVNKKRVEKNWFKTKIIAFISFYDSFSAQPILVFDNGFCQSINNAIKNRREDHKQRIIGSDEIIQFVDAFVDNQIVDYFNIYLITRSASEESQTIPNIKSIYKLIINRETDDIIKIESQSVVNNLKHWSLCGHLSSLLAVDNSSDHLLIYSLNGKTEKLLFKLESTSIKSVISFGTTSNGSICLIGKTIDGNYSLELWETKYGTKLGEICLPYEPIVNDCKVIDDTIYITCYKGVLSIPIKTQSVCLSQIVGKTKSNESNLELNFCNELKEICADFDSAKDQSYDDISERFSRLIKQINGNIPEDIILQLFNVCSLKLMDSNCDELKKIFNELVSLPFNDVFMISKLKSSPLKFDQILLSLDLLSELLPSTNCAVIDWMCILIDSYMNQFIVNPNENTIRVIKHISSKIEHFSQFYEKMGDIKNLFDIIMANNNKNMINSSNFPKPKRGQYSIELLRI
jgi:hypothetical protein